MNNLNLNLNERFAYTPSSTLVKSFVTKVYGWMFFALFLTGITSVWAATSSSFQEIIRTYPILMWVLIMGEFGLVVWLYAGIKSIKSGTATLLFLVYSILNGLTLSTIFQIYSLGTISSAFFSSALMFGAMSTFGLITKKDLSSWGHFLGMGLIGLIIASIVNLFISSTALDWLISYLGVFIFLGLTAYDTQEIKAMAYNFKQGCEAEAEIEAKEAIVGALKLYLDFINLFLFLLRIFARRD